MKGLLELGTEIRQLHQSSGQRIDYESGHVVGIPIGDVKKLPRRIYFTEFGNVPTGNGEPGIGDRTPVAPSIAYTEMLFELALTTYKKLLQDRSAAELAREHCRTLEACH